MRCDAELCPYWTGQGCICAVIDMDHGNQLTGGATVDEDYRDEKWQDAQT